MSLHHGLRIVSGAIEIETDPYFSNTVLLLNGNGTNGGQNNTFIDSSANNFTITRFGNTTQGSFSPFGWQWSNYFDGSGDYLSVANNAALQLGSSDFTIECWVYLNALSTTNGIYAKRSNSGYGDICIVANNANLQVTGSTSGTSWAFADKTVATGLAVGSWYHIAVVRNGGSITGYVNGTSSSSQAVSDSLYDSGQASTIGSSNAGASQFINGYIANFRLTKSALYTSNFTPSTTPLTAIANTQLLTCQSNRFIDNSSNAFAITRNGDVRVSNFAPFPAGEYAASVEGGSGYFDGTGDYLEHPSSTNINFGTGDFTVEFWVYFITLSAYVSIIDHRAANTIGSNILLQAGPTGTLLLHVNGSNRILSSAGTVSAGSWHHVALTRSGTSTKIFANGTQAGSTYTDTTNYTTVRPRIGQGNYTSFPENLNGYISSVRFLKGAAQYTSNFTPSTTPLTAIANTSLLLNFTNGSIVDATGKNDLETVGNAQVSTSVKKYGTGSMAFDGTGDILNARYDPSVFLLSGSYTIEAWIYPTTVSGSRSIFNIATTFTANYGELTLAQNNASVRFAIRPTTGGSVTQISGGTMTANTWYHVAVSVSNLSARLFLDGTQVGSTTTIPNFSFTPGGVGVGGNWNGYTNTSWFLGNIADLRVTKGIARYISNFTPPYRQLPTR